MRIHWAHKEMSFINVYIVLCIASHRAIFSNLSCLASTTRYIQCKGRSHWLTENGMSQLNLIIQTFIKKNPSYSINRWTKSILLLPYEMHTFRRYLWLGIIYLLNNSKSFWPFKILATNSKSGARVIARKGILT